MSFRILALSKSNIIQTSLAISLKSKSITIDRLDSWDRLAEQMLRHTYNGLVLDSKIIATKNLTDFFRKKNLPELPLLILLNKNEGIGEYESGGSETEFLEKPFLTDELEQTISRLLHFSAKEEDDSTDVTDPDPPLASLLGQPTPSSIDRFEKSSMSFIDAESDDEAAKTVIAESTDRPKHSVDLDHFDLEAEETSEGDLSLPEDDGQGEISESEFYLTEDLEEIPATPPSGSAGDRILNEIGDTAFLGNEAVESDQAEGFVEPADLSKTILDPFVLAEADLDNEDWNADFKEDEAARPAPMESDLKPEISAGIDFFPKEKDENSLNDLLVSSEEIDQMEESDLALDSAIFDTFDGAKASVFKSGKETSFDSNEESPSKVEWAPLSVKPPSSLPEKNEQGSVITAPIENSDKVDKSWGLEYSDMPLGVSLGSMDKSWVGEGGLGSTPTPTANRASADFTGFQIVEHSDMLPIETSAETVESFAIAEGPPPGASEYRYFNFEEALSPMAEPVFTAPAASDSKSGNGDVISNAGGSDFIDRISDSEVDSYLHNLVQGNFRAEKSATVPVQAPPLESMIVAPTVPTGQSPLSAITDKKIESVLSQSIERIVAEYIAKKAPQIIEDIVQKRINRILSDLLGEKET